MIGATGLLTIRLRGAVGLAAPISESVVRTTLTSTPHDRILVDIETDGGEVDEAFRIFELLRAQPLPMAAISGKCHSAGMIILMGAALRLAKPNATFLLHPLSVSKDDLSPAMTIKSLRDEARRLEVKHNRNINLIADRTGFNRVWFCDEAETEQMMDVAAAIACGVVHAIEGAPGPCNPEWPQVAKRILAEERHVFLPQHLTSANFLDACRISAHFQGALG